MNLFLLLKIHYLILILKKKKYKGNKSHKSNESSENTFLNNKKKLKYNDKYYINIFIYF